MDMTSLLGSRFGRLQVTGFFGKRGNDTYWTVSCDCGKQKQVSKGNLRSGRVNSCGCLSAELVSARSKTHGMRHTRVYTVYRSMMNRCNLPSDTNYCRYGAKGITVDPAWSTFEKFIEDMGEPEKGLELDRIDNTKGYSKENCRWVTREVNANNKSNNRLFTFNGKTQNLKQWSEETGIKLATLSSRLYLYEWSEEKAFTTGVIKHD